MHIVIDGHSLGILGGIERVVCDLASAMVQRGHQVSVFISEPLPKNPIYPVDKRVCFVVYSHGGRQKYLAEFRQQILACAPDVCISPAADRRHLPWCAALWNSGIPLVVSEHSTPEDIESRIWNRSERLAVMTAADVIHVLRNSCVSSLPGDLHDRVHVIPNAATLPVLPKVHLKGRHTIVSMGRLDRDKQNHLLVNAFAALAPEFPQWHLDIWGTGPEQRRLKKQLRQLGLTDRVHICGLTTKPEECYATADVVCHPSRHEALPNTVIEAMAAGVPVVGFAGCPGVNELVCHGETGLLVSEMSSDALAHTLRVLLQSPVLRKEMGDKSRRMAAAYAPQAVYDAWEELLETALLYRGKTHLRDEIGTAPSPCDSARQRMQFLKQCMGHPNILVGKGNLLRRIVFSSPWLVRMLRPVHTWLKGKIGMA